MSKETSDMIKFHEYLKKQVDEDKHDIDYN
jgi:hypothetical protein